MPTYIYETIPQTEAEEPKRFELRQSMTEKALTQHPESGQPVRRVVVGGSGMMGAIKRTMPSMGGCGTGCGCH
jgi:predicted nucleic acid-binding Zn ribbon protein